MNTRFDNNSSVDLPWLTKTIYEIDSSKKSVLRSNQLLSDEIAQRREAERKLRESEARLRDFADIASDWFWETDEALRITYLSSNVSQFLGVDAAELVGRDLVEVCPGLDEASRRGAEDHRQVLERQEPFRDFEYPYSLRNGEVRIFQRSGKPVFDSQGRFKGYRGTTLDISERKKAEERIRFLANHDTLTGLPILRLIRDRIEMAIERAIRNRSGVAILFMDLNKFKPINDELGHRIGDQILTGVVDRLKSAVCQSDTVGRIGGDEFVVVMSDIHGSDDYQRVIDKVQRSVTEPFDVEGMSLEIGLSIGVSLYPEHGKDRDTLIHRADMAMYQAKRAPDACYKVYSE
ncbi:MAG: sensor domain-containing diguanylate cyclase [Candidatus Sedimenticola endophacoides]